MGTAPTSRVVPAFTIDTYQHVLPDMQAEASKTEHNAGYGRRAGHGRAPSAAPSMPCPFRFVGTSQSLSGDSCRKHQGSARAGDARWDPGRVWRVGSVVYVDPYLERDVLVEHVGESRGGKVDPAVPESAITVSVEVEYANRVGAADSHIPRVHGVRRDLERRSEIDSLWRQARQFFRVKHNLETGSELWMVALHGEAAQIHVALGVLEYQWCSGLLPV